MKVNVAGLTDPGKKRENNEDTFLINQDLNLFIVADGMGGHLGGEHASKTSVTTIESTLQELESNHDHPFYEHAKDPDVIDQDKLRYCLQTASHTVYKQSLSDKNLQGMGTTTVAIHFKQGKLYCANVGDSRAYFIKDGRIRQMTDDHSLVNEQLKAGLITQEAAIEHPYKNVITRSIGFQDVVEVDVVTIDVFPKDRFLLCSDGLTNMVSDEEIAKICSMDDPKTAVAKLIELANNAGGEDNITVVLVEVLENNS